MTVLFYPELPQPHNRIYQALTQIGIPFHNDPNKDHNIVIYWSYNQTIYTPNAFLKSRKRLVNGGCFDITKTHVDKVFGSQFIDPTTYEASYVKKSERQARHDGQIFNTKQKREKGFVYQKFINTKNEDGLYVDYRMFWSGNIDMIVAKYKKHPFKNDMVKCRVMDDFLSAAQKNKISKQIRAFGMHFGEVDFLIDSSGNPVIIDINNIPGRGVFSHISSIYWALYKRSLEEFLIKWPLLGGFSLGHNTVDTIQQHTSGKKVLELGSGKGSMVLSRFSKLYSIEDNKNFSENYKGGTVFHVPIEDDWYNIEMLKEAISKVEYDFLIMDGPAKANRVKFFENFHLFKKVPFLIDDTHRDMGKELVRLFEEQGYKFEFIEEPDKQSALCLTDK
jgi:hypothetical protein